MKLPDFIAIMKSAGISDEQVLVVLSGVDFFDGDTAGRRVADARPTLADAGRRVADAGYKKRVRSQEYKAEQAEIARAKRAAGKLADAGRRVADARPTLADAVADAPHVVGAPAPIRAPVFPVGTFNKVPELDNPPKNITFGNTKIPPSEEPDSPSSPVAAAPVGSLMAAAMRLLPEEPPVEPAAPAEPPAAAKATRRTPAKPPAALAAILEILVPVLGEDVSAELIEHRKSKKAPLTKGAAKALIREFAKWDGDPRQAAAEMMLQGWQGFKAEWMKKSAISAAAAAKTPFPVGLQPTRADWLVAEAAGMSKAIAREQWSVWSDRNIARDFLSSDWSASWRDHCNKWKERNERERNRGSPRRDPTIQAFDELQQELEDRKNGIARQPFTDVTAEEPGVARLIDLATSEYRDDARADRGTEEDVHDSGNSDG